MTFAIHTSNLISTLVLFFLLSTTTAAFAQVETFRVQFNQVDANYSNTEDSTTISRNTSARLDKLFIFLGGTGSNSSIAYDGLRRHAAALGFDAINLSYLNSIPAASLKDNSDSLAFNHYRQEICFGTPVSDTVSVDSLNSIATRVENLLRYLTSTRPSGGWDKYLTTSATIDWSKVTIAGHSQGAGHAAYLGKQFSMERVLMFAGPNDYSDQFSSSANWLRESGITPVARHLAYLSLNDEIVDFSKQYENLAGLGIQDSTFVDDITAPYRNAQLLYTTQSLGLNHSAPTRFSLINRDVWTYMLTSSISTSVQMPAEKFELSVYPNPVHEELHLSSAHDLSGKRFSLTNPIGQTVLAGKLDRAFENMIDVSDVLKGLYFITIDGQTISIVKE